MRRFNFIYKLILLVVIALPVLVWAFDVPARPTGFVQDYAAMLSPEQVTMLETKLEQYEQNTTNEIAVVTISSLDGDVIENVAQDIFTTWGIGKKDKNNGVLVLVSLDDRKARIQTGYGVEGDLPDLATKYIQEDVLVPAFKNGDYYEGLDGSVDKIIEALGGDAIVPENYGQNESANFPWETVIFFVFIVFQILVSLLGRSKSWWGGGVLGAIVAGIIWHFFISSIVIAVITVIGFVVSGLVFDFVASRAYAKADLHKKRFGAFPWWWFIGGGRGGRGGGGFGGGGFGGFGGGSSGGGGSSSSW